MLVYIFLAKAGRQAFKSLVCREANIINMISSLELLAYVFGETGVRRKLYSMSNDGFLVLHLFAGV